MENKNGIGKRMGYRGRITSIIFIGSILLFIRQMVNMHFGQVPHPFPLPAIIALIIAWFLGKQYDKYVYLSSRDTLTGLFNRRYVLDNFSRIIQQANKRNANMAILLLDVNDFKEINDQHGHEYGDEVLEGISEILLDSFDPKEVIARWGGDEFLVLSIFNKENEIMEKIERFEHLIKNNEWRHHHNGLSVSIGKADFPNNGKSLKELVAKADSNMYAVKMNHKQKREGKKTNF